jgi:hypothetical protein
LQQPGWSQNVIDVDTYGIPWRHWLAMLPNVTKSLTVFLTIGRIILAAGGRSVSRQELELTDCRFGYLPQAFGPSVSNLAVGYALAEASRHGLTITEALEAETHGNARYLGLRLEKIQKST